MTEGLYLTYKDIYLSVDFQNQVTYIMSRYKFTDYFENQILRKRPYLKKEWCYRVLNNPESFELQDNNRFRFWGRIKELNYRYLRVVTLSDKITIHNAFPDRGHKK